MPVLPAPSPCALLPGGLVRSQRTQHRGIALGHGPLRAHVARNAQEYDYICPLAVPLRLQAAHEKVRLLAGEGQATVPDPGRQGRQGEAIRLQSAQREMGA
jgi:hypothetical protein